MDIFRKLFEGLDYKQESTVIDFGAGIGTLAEIWRSEVDVSPICIEIDRHQINLGQ
jgi:cyclopropane fatty-acyl-phospholipid synthase-like methyltransferase